MSLQRLFVHCVLLSGPASSMFSSSVSSSSLWFSSLNNWETNLLTFLDELSGCSFWTNFVFLRRIVTNMMIPTCLHRRKPLWWQWWQHDGKGDVDMKINSIVLAPSPSYISWFWVILSCFPQPQDISPGLRESNLVTCSYHPCQRANGARPHPVALHAHLKLITPSTAMWSDDVICF